MGVIRFCIKCGIETSKWKYCELCFEKHNLIYHRKYSKSHDKERYEKNREKRKEQMKIWNAKNEEKVSEYHKKRHKENYIKRKRKIVTKEVMKERDEKKKEYARAYYKRYYKKNISQKIAQRFRERLWRLLKGKKVKFKIEELIGCTKEYLVSYLKNKFEKGMTLENHGEWHIDHIKPCISFDLRNDDELKKCFHYTNLQPLWAKDNLAKGIKVKKIKKILAC